ncbi:MAG: universal stress protein [Chloroflexota bacterium]
MKILTGLHDLPGNEPTIQTAELAARLSGAELVTRQEMRAGRLLVEATKGGYDLIVMRWTGNARLDQAACIVATRADVSVWVVKGQPNPEAVQRILVCSGGRPISEQVITTGAWLAGLSDAEVTLLHVSSAVPGMYTGLTAMDGSIEELLSSNTPAAQNLLNGLAHFRERGIKTVFELRQGSVHEEIVRAVRRVGYDLAVIGPSAPATTLDNLLNVPVAEKILRLSPCSVLVARGAPQTVDLR